MWSFSGKLLPNKFSQWILVERLRRLVPDASDTAQRRCRPALAPRRCSVREREPPNQPCRTPSWSDTCPCSSSSDKCPRRRKAMTFPTKVLNDSLGRIGSLKRTSDKSLFPMALGSCGHRITHQLRPINMNGRSILSETSRVQSLCTEASNQRTGLRCPLSTLRGRK